jgi:hypothetical protein
MSNNQISLFVRIFSWLLIGISTVVALMFFLGVVTEDTFIIWAYILLAIASVLAIVFPVIFFAMYPKNALKALVGLAGLGVVFLIGYLMADSTPMVSVTNNPNFSDPKVLAFSDTGIFATYILFGVAVLALIFTGIRSIFNR